MLLLHNRAESIIHCSKYLKEHLLISIGDNVNTCPIDKPYILLDNKVETQFLLIFLQGESKYWIKKVFDKTIADQVHGSNFVIFNFLENDDFLWNSIEALKFLIA